MAAQCENEDWQCNKSFLECSKHMFKHGVATDVTFLVGASEDVVQAHKFVLVARSPVFETMLCGSLQENPKGILIYDTDIETFKAFLWSLYCDENKIETNNAVGLHYLATKYMVPGLQKAASDFMQSNMCSAPDLLCSTFNYSVITDDTALQESCVLGFSQQKEVVMNSNHLLELSKDAVSKLAESNELAVPEVLLFKGCNRWAERQCREQGVPTDGPNKRAQLGDIIPKIRFPLMSAAEFADNVSKEEILSPQETIAMFQHYTSESTSPVPYATDPRIISMVKITLQLGGVGGGSRRHVSMDSRIVTVNCNPRQSGRQLRTLFQTNFGTYYVPGMSIIYDNHVVSDADIVHLTEMAVVSYQ